MPVNDKQRITKGPLGDKNVRRGGLPRAKGQPAPLTSNTKPRPSNGAAKQDNTARVRHQPEIRK